MGALKYTGFDLAKNYEDGNAPVLYFDYTNQQDETSTYSGIFSLQVFQNGIECDSTTLSYDAESQPVDMRYKEIQKGQELNIKQ